MLMAETPESPPSAVAPGPQRGKTGIRLATTVVHPAGACPPSGKRRLLGGNTQLASLRIAPQGRSTARPEMQWQHGIRTVATRGTYSGNTVHRKGIDFGQSGVPQAGGNGGNTDADDQNDSGFARRHPRPVRGPKPGAIRASLFSALSRKRSRVWACAGAIAASGSA